MPMPIRLQLSRRKGFSLQALSLATNGLPAIVVTRRGLLGNPFKIGESSGVFPVGMGMHGRAEILIEKLTREQAVELFGEAAQGFLRPEMYPAGHEWVARLKTKTRCWHPAEAVRYLARGKNVACSCGLDELCHGDTVLEIANR